MDETNVDAETVTNTRDSNTYTPLIKTSERKMMLLIVEEVWGCDSDFEENWLDVKRTLEA